MKISISSFAGKGLLVPVFFLFLTGMTFAVDIEVTTPHFTDTTGSYPEIDELNELIENSFSKYQDLISSTLDFLPSSFANFAKAFANTTVFTSDGASQRSYEGYKTFSFTVGFMGAIQIPKGFTAGEGGVGLDLIKNNMDMGLGLDLQIINAQLGINTSKFLLDGLYLGLKFSMFDTNWIKTIDLSGFSFKTMSFGINASYQLIKQKRLLGNIFIWRGLSLGTGVIWQNTSFGIMPSLAIDENISFGDISMNICPVFQLGIDTNTCIIPIEAITSMRLLWFLNASLGAGFDIAFGRSSISPQASINVTDVSLPPGVYMDTSPTLKCGIGGESAPSLFNVKIMASAGFNFGPVVIDIPFSYYFMNNGYSLGITFGLTF